MPQPEPHPPHSSYPLEGPDGSFVLVNDGTLDVRQIKHEARGVEQGDLFLVFNVNKKQ